MCGVEVTGSRDAIRVVAHGYSAVFTRTHERDTDTGWDNATIIGLRLYVKWGDMNQVRGSYAKGEIHMPCGSYIHTESAFMVQ